jgi:hypothetical protein
LGSRSQQVGHCPGGAWDQDTFVKIRGRIDSKDELTGKVLGGVGHETVLAHGDDCIIRFEKEPRKVLAPDPADTPVDRDRGENKGQGGLETFVAQGHLGDVLPPGLEKKFCLPEGGVARQE